MTAPVLLIATSTSRLGDTGRSTGCHFEELATPYYTLIDAGYDVEIASTAGGAVPIDNERPRGENPASVERFLDDGEALANLRASKPVAQIDPDAYAGVYLPGGHGTMWDFPNNPELATVLVHLFEAGRPVAAVCHGPAAFVGARLSDGRPLVAGRRVNSFTDAEEQAVELDGVVPFLLASRLREEGAQVEGAGKFESFVVTDGNLLTGQNPPSVEPLAEALRDALAGRAARAAG